MLRIPVAICPFRPGQIWRHRYSPVGGFVVLKVSFSESHVRIRTGRADSRVTLGLRDLWRVCRRHYALVEE